MAVGDAVLPHNASEGNEHRLMSVAMQGELRLLPKMLKPLGRRLCAGRIPRKSEDLIVDDVIAVAAPRVKHHRVVSHIARQKLRRHGEAFGTFLDEFVA